MEYRYYLGYDSKGHRILSTWSEQKHCKNCGRFLGLYGKKLCEKCSTKIYYDRRIKQSKLWGKNNKDRCNTNHKTVTTVIMG